MKKKVEGSPRQKLGAAKQSVRDLWNRARETLYSGAQTKPSDTDNAGYETIQRMVKWQ